MDGIIQQGAEAILIKKGKLLLKKRNAKNYRIHEIDKTLRKTRTKKESKLLKKTSDLIPVPKLKEIKENEILMEFIEGKKLSESLEEMKEWEFVCKEIGRNIAKLHDAEIIHGDLTTSNMIFSEREKKVYFIDFGLGFGNGKFEDKAVDLYLLKNALEAKHFNSFEKFFNAVLEGYKFSKNFEKVLNQMKSVEKRGRYKRAE